MQKLTVYDGGVTGATLAGLGSHAQLTTLNLTNNKIDSLDGVGPFPGVEWLSLSQNPLPDAAMERLPSVFPALKHLDITGTRVTDEGMKHIAKLPELGGLYVGMTKVTGRGVLEVVSNRKLLAVTIEERAVTKDDRDTIQKRRPNDLSLILLDTEGRARWALSKAGGDW